MESVQLTIDGIEVEAEKGTKVLTAALHAGIHIPNLCYLPEADLPYGGCRLCYVDVEGRGPVTACTLPVSQGLVINTRTPEVDRLRKTAFKLLIAYHDLDCRNCWKNKRCALQKTAAKVKVKLKTPGEFRDLPKEPIPPEQDQSVYHLRSQPVHPLREMRVRVYDSETVNRCSISWEGARNQNHHVHGCRPSGIRMRGLRGMRRRLPYGGPGAGAGSRSGTGRGGIQVGGQVTSIQRNTDATKGAKTANFP